jgi:putative PEP-CTERM system TPR-repeat lipoprotein
MARGKKLAEQKDYARALIEFKNAARIQPKSAETYYQAALVYLASDNYRDAYASLNRAIKLDPKHAGAQAKMAEIIGPGLAAARPTNPEVLQKAEKQIQSVLAVLPDNTDALNALGMAEYLRGNSDEAVKQLRGTLDKFPQDFQAARALAFINLEHKDFAGAEQVLKETVGKNPKSSEAHLALGQLYVAKGRNDIAEASFRRALQINPNFGPALLDLARLEFSTGRKDEAERILARLSMLPDKQYRSLHAMYLFGQGKKDDAIRELADRVARDPDDRGTFQLLTFAYFATGRYPDAQKAVDTALKRNAKNSDALAARAELYIHTGKLAEAEADLNQLLGLQPDSATAHYLLSRIFRARGEQLSCREQLGTAVRLNPSLLAWRLELADDLMQSRAATAALDLLRQAPEPQKSRVDFKAQWNWALRAKGDKAAFVRSVEQGLGTARTADFLLQDAIIKAEQRQFSPAEASLLEALRRAPGDLRIPDALARLYSQENQPAKATRTLTEFAKARPGSAQAQILLARWLLRTGDSKAARAAFEAAKSADATFTSADLELARLDMAQGYMNAARTRLSALTKLKPVDAWKRADAISALVLLANLEEISGNHALAIEGYRRVLDADSSNYMALNNLSYLLVTYANRPDEGLKYAQQAKEAAPSDPNVSDTIGWAFYQKGLYQTALQYLEDASSKDNGPLHKYHLAMAYMKTGDRSKAEQILAQAQRLNPNLPEATVARGLLGGMAGSRN